MYKSRLGSKDTSLILSQEKTMNTTPSPKSHKEKRKNARRMSKRSPTQSGPEEKKQKMECKKCEEVIEGTSITCTWCKFTLCQPCSKLKEGFIELYNAEDLPGVAWKCASCEVTSDAFQCINKKLDDMGKTVEGMEDRISNKIKADLPGMIKNEVKGLRQEMNKKMESEVKKLEDNIGQEITDQIGKVEKRIDETTESIMTKEDIEGLMKKMIKSEMEKNQAAAPQAGTSGTQSSPGTQMKKTVASVTAEIREKAKREKRIVIYNLDENDTNVREERKNLDKDKFFDIAQNTLGIKNMKKDEITTSDRLGEKAEGRPRPLLIEVSNLYRKNLIMKKPVNLHGSEYQHLSFKHDMTRLEREQQRKLTEKAREMEAESGGKWRFRVRGPRPGT